MSDKPLKVKDSKYKYWLAEKPCICSELKYFLWMTDSTFTLPIHCNGKSSPPHHLPNPEHGKRRSRDDMQIPCCLRLHVYLHEHPKLEKELLDFLYSVAKKYWNEYSER